MLRIYYAEFTERLDQVDWDGFSVYRKEKLSRISAASARRQGIAAELLLIHALRTERPALSLPLELTVGQYGKPALPGSDLHFSLSHTRGCAVCAVADREIGVDVEGHRRYSEALARRFLHPEELRFLQSAEDPDMCFTMLWTLKESYLKALGTGLYRPLNSFAIDCGAVLAPADEPMPGFWHTWRDGCHFAACMPGQPALIPDTFEKLKLP